MPPLRALDVKPRHYGLIWEEQGGEISVDNAWVAEEIAHLLEFSKIRPETDLRGISDLMNLATLMRGLNCRVFHHTTLEAILR